MKRKITFGLLLLSVSVLSPACKHEQPDAAKLYLKYLNGHIKK
ncbi:hypothetical protein [Pedobacter sp. MC2016-14]|nr:hypothetical protein [Pedobacter sp. MC2016-14]